MRSPIYLKSTIVKNKLSEIDINQNSPRQFNTKFNNKLDKIRYGKPQSQIELLEPSYKSTLSEQNKTSK